MKDVRAVFFDAGGTLIHLDVPFILATLATHGVVRDAAAFRLADVAARTRVSERLRAGERIDDRARWGVYANALLEALGCDDAMAGSVRMAVATHSRAGLLFSHTEPGTAAALAAIRAAGLTLGVVSNSDGRVARFLEAAGLLPHLDFVIDSGDVGVEKPDPRIFHIACERAGVAPADAIHVGDLFEIDVLGARAAGVMPVLVDPDDVAPYADCVRIGSVTELPALLLTPRPV